jgi:hypothetical protein
MSERARARVLGRGGSNGNLASWGGPSWWARVLRCLQDIDDGATEVVNHHFVKQALQPLVAVLLEQLVKQDEGQDLDDNTWNLSMAGGTCLGLVAAAVGDEVVQIVMPFVQVRCRMEGATCCCC